MCTLSLFKDRYRKIFADWCSEGTVKLSAANEDISYAELRYIKRKFINVVNVRQAIAHVINAILEIRDPSIWGTIMAPKNWTTKIAR